MTLLTDGYADDWSELWWAKAEGTASVSAEPPADLDLLLDRYPQYQGHPPRGPFISVEVRRWSGWSAAP